MAGSTEIKVLVIGAGSIGRRHAKNLLTLGAKVGIYDVDQKLAEEFSGESRFEHVKDFSKALDNGDYRAALVCTPSHLHISTALSIAENEIDLFIEKPLSNTLEGVSQLLDKIRTKRLVCMCGFNLRYEPGLKRLKTQIDPGRVAFAEIENGSYLPGWKPGSDYRKSYSANKRMGGGIILDGVHEIDYACWLFGYPESVSSTCGKFSDLEIDVEDTVDYHFHYRDKTVTVHSDYIQKEYTRRCKICLKNGDLIEWMFGSHVQSLTDASNLRYDYKPTFHINQMYLDEMREFLNSLRTRVIPESDLTNAKKILEIALAAKDASD